MRKYGCNKSQNPVIPPSSPHIFPLQLIGFGYTCMCIWLVVILGNIIVNITSGNGLDLLAEMPAYATNSKSTPNKSHVKYAFVLM